MQNDKVYSFDQLMLDCGRLSDRYSFIGQHVIGRSVMGRPLVALSCGCGSRQIHINASFHANEWITSLLLMRFVSELSQSLVDGSRLCGQDTRHLCRGVTLWLVPMVNPDGVELAQRGAAAAPSHYEQLLQWNGGLTDFSGWKANIRGVDLNDQFPAFWEEEYKRRGVSGPSPRDYPGQYPLSEPEAIAMAEFTERLRFDAALALHTQGREIYWNYRDYEPEQSEEIARRLGSVSGYQPVKLSGSDAGYKDWFIQRYRKPGFTVEAGYGENPLPISGFEQMYAELKPLLLESLRI